MWSRVWALPSGAVGLLVAALFTSACHGAPAAHPSSSAPATSASATPSVTQAANAVSGPVVALGDSYTAGAMLPMEPHATPPGCLRSAKAYPVLVATALHAPLTDVACASAGVKNMTAAQPTYLGTNPAQFTALGPADRVVLLTLSGDDMGFLNVLKECVSLSFANPMGSPCRTYYGDTSNALVAAESAKMTLVLQAIAQRAPRARIVVVGYPDMFPQSGGCWPRVPITSGDIAYLRGIEFQVNAMLAAVAQSAGATFVDTYTPTIGHDFCQPESVRDVEGLIPGSLALPFHPNARGQAAIAAAVLGALLPP
ncbi:SGNH/GDSL hydrolase family protein [Trebonia kvetii]|uniref:SGNH/GDSL hydrolase family protein n=1 Tax=Trebonia kvetii TaxID=2480626 RepID=A0A6P2C6S0_9ACTN|nr:SGNH/GDSL hydrolase family protein [Trebonia kvetii]TVZ07129.1 SGNH/GDSL hydrolase family protein [Trebonia kvetii]